MMQKTSAMRFPYRCCCYYYDSSSPRPQPRHTNKNTYSSSRYNSFLIVVIRLQSDHCRVLRILAQAVILALLITGLPLLGGSGRPDNINYLTSSAQLDDDKLAADHGNVPMIDARSMSVLFHDLANEGLYKHDDKIAFVLSSASNVEAINTSNILIGQNIGHADIITPQRDEKATAYDFVFTDSLRATGLAAKRLKAGGIIAFQLGDHPTYFANNKPLPSHFITVYFRRLSGALTYVAMKKAVDSYSTGSGDGVQSPMHQRRRLQSFDFPPADHHEKTYDEKRKAAALKKLEGVQLEEPRTTSQKSRSYYMKKTRYLPDLLNDSLENYPRRLFIDIGTPQDKDKTSGTEWFKKNYPTRNKEFQLYHMEAMTIDEGDDDDGLKPLHETMTTANDGDDGREIGMSDWLKMYVKEDEYVVMKAEAEVVEDLVKTKAIELVDELFMECKTSSSAKGRGRRGRGANNKKRPYWECLALYGRLRDLGVAVHQWWG